MKLCSAFQSNSVEVSRRAFVSSSARFPRPHTAHRPQPRLVVAAQSSSGGGGLEGFINNISVAIKNLPLNQGKKQLAIMQAGTYDAAAVKAKVDAYIRDSPVVVFSWTTCPFCVKAKGLLTDLGAKYTAVELNTMEEGAAMRAELAKMTDRTSMPNIWIAGQSVGGCNDGPGVMTLNREGRLVEMLKEAGAL